MSLDILIVDDTMSIAECLKELLEIKGHNVTLAFHHNQGKAILEERKHDFYVFDRHNPVTDGGYELLDEVRSRYGDVPVYLITSASRGEEERARKAGFTGFFAKPFNLGVFCDTVSSYEKTRQ